jgi:AraC-like DNA-binding protein
MCRIRHINDFIGAHLDEAVTLDDLAHAAHVSPAHLVRFYQGMVGESPMQTMRRLRLKRAFSQIEQGHFGRVTDVGFTAGYGSSAAFNHAFRKEFGIAPKDVPTLLPIAEFPALRLEYIPERKVFQFSYEGLYSQNGFYKARMMWLCHAAERDALLSWRLNDRDHPFSEKRGQQVQLTHFMPVSDQSMSLKEADLVTHPGGLYAVVEALPGQRADLLTTLAERIRHELDCQIIEGRTLDRDIHERACQIPQERRIEVFIPVAPIARRGQQLSAVARQKCKF